MFIWVKILQVSKTSVFINNVLVGGVDCLHIIEKVIIALKVSVSVISQNAGKRDQKISKYGHFLDSVYFTGEEQKRIY